MKLTKNVAVFCALAAFAPGAFGQTQATAKRSVRLAICQILAIDGDREGNFPRDLNIR